MERKAVSATRYKTKTGKKEKEFMALHLENPLPPIINRHNRPTLKVITINKAALTQSRWFYLTAEIPPQTSTRRGCLHHLHWPDLQYIPRGRKRDNISVKGSMYCSTSNPGVTTCKMKATPADEPTVPGCQSTRTRCQWWALCALPGPRTAWCYCLYSARQRLELHHSTPLEAQREM